MDVQQHQNGGADDGNQCGAQEIFQVLERYFFFLIRHRLGKGDPVGPEQSLIENGEQRDVKQRCIRVKLHHQRDTHEANVAKHDNGTKHMAAVPLELEDLFQQQGQ